MLTRTSIAGFVAVLLSGASSANAATMLATAPAFAEGGQSIVCTAVNVGTTPVTIVFEAVEFDGTVDTTMGGVAGENLNPGTGDFLIGDAATSAWCRITVTKGSAKKVRAMAIYDDGTELWTTVPAQ